MTLSRTTGTITLTDTTETELFTPLTALKYYSTNVFLDNLITDSVVIIRVYTMNNTTLGEELYDSQTFKGVQNDPVIFIPYIPVEGSGAVGYRVTAQRSSASSIVIDWDRYET